MAGSHHDELSDTDKEMLECEALKACGDPETAKRLVAAWYRVETRLGVNLKRRFYPPPQAQGASSDGEQQCHEQ